MYPDQKEPKADNSDFERGIADAIEALVKKFPDVDRAIIEQTYRQAHQEISAGATVKDFISVLAARQAMDMLKDRGQS